MIYIIVFILGGIIGIGVAALILGTSDKKAYQEGYIQGKKDECARFLMALGEMKKIYGCKKSTEETAEDPAETTAETTDEAPGKDA